MRSDTYRRIKCFILCLVLLAGYKDVYPQSISSMDREAELHLKKKEFSKAIVLWLGILDVDPENEMVQKKIEKIYELKQRKDMAFQRAKINYKIARKTLIITQKSDDLSDDEIEKNLIIMSKRSRIAINSFVTAYRIDPKDPEFIDMKVDMKKLQDEVNAELEKDKLSRELKRRNKLLRKLARQMMAQENYEKALGYWTEILTFLPKDKIALEGRRKSKLAIDNRLMFERIKNLMLTGETLFKEKKYNESKLEFTQVLNIDPENDDAKEFIEQIDEKLEEKRNREAIKLQAEDFYLSGIKNLTNNKFDLAREDFESAGSLIKNYKDISGRLKSIDRLRKDYENREKAAKLVRINTEFQNGLIALSEANYKAAISAFEKTLSLDPKNLLAKTYISRAKDALKLIEEERVDINSPYYNIIQSLIVTGRLLYDKGKYLDSKKKWDQILKLFPKNRIAAEYSLRVDLRLNPGAYKIFSKRVVSEGKELLDKKKYKPALKKFELIKSITGSYPGIDELIAKSKDGLKKGERIAVFAVIGKKVKNLTPVNKNEIEKRYRLGLTLYQRGGRQNIRNALANLKFVVQNDPGNIKAIISVNKIESELRIGRTVAVVQRRRLTPQQRNLARKHYYQGINYYSNNNFKRAVTEWRKVLAIDPNHRKARNNLRKVLAFIRR